MTDIYALHEGKFGRAVVLELRDSLVAHSHAESQFAFWLGGSEVEATVGDQVVRYSEDVALGTNEYESHDARLMDPSRKAIFLVIYIRREWLQDLREQTGRPFFFPAPQVPISVPLRQACWRMLDAILARHQHTDDDIDEGVEALVQTAIDTTLSQATGATPRKRPALLDPRVRAAVQYMRKHVHVPLALEEVAAAVGLSRTQFFTVFRDQLQTTPQVFWSAVRVEEAVRRLLEGSKPPQLTSLALDLGFSSPGNFSRFFREHMGVSPSGFRRAASALNILTGVQ
jgi:AraC-like DNA-binding protein